MPPRLPTLPRPKGYSYSANPFADVVQLGFLLPWANTTRTRSSSTTSTTSGICSASFGSGSGSSSNSSLKKHTEASSSNSQTRPSPTFIHRNLSRPNPPSPSDLLNHLKARPSLLTRSSGELLARYARRVSDLRSERESERFMIRRRVGPLTKSSHHHHHHKRYKGKGKGKGKSKEIDGYFQVPISTVDNKYDHPLRPNLWALNNFPPISKLPSRKYTSKQLLNHTHWLILRGQEPDFQNALGLLETTVDWNTARGGHKARWRWETLNMLHLYLSYAGKKFQRRKRKSQSQSQSQLEKSDNPSDIDVDTSQIDKFTWPSALLETYLSLNIQTESPPPNRQTLHLLIIASLTFIHRHKSTSTYGPKEILGIIDDFRKKYRITPGPETFRHIALTALKIDDAELAREAWVGWEMAMRRLQFQVDSSRSIDSAELKGQRQSSFRSKPQGEGEGEVRIRFRNIGTYKRRWNTVRKAIQEKARVGEIDKEKEMNLQKPWKWIARLESLNSKSEGDSPPSSLPPSITRPRPRPYSPFLLPVKPYSPGLLSNPFPFRYSPAPPVALSPPRSWNYERQPHDESADEPEREAARATS